LRCFNSVSSAIAPARVIGILSIGGVQVVLRVALFKGHYHINFK